ncbi:MAG: SEC-C domain-containing protein [Candidatus Obscuribacterales bacterium]|jgi:hypothetical protein|nr:SEC-C domain-containing protein [Candidatus Obscuribacterales bacterium]
MVEEGCVKQVPCKSFSVQKIAYFLSIVYTEESPDWRIRSCSKKTATFFNFEISSKRRKGFPSETKVKRGSRVVHGIKELEEKLGRNDLCPCGSARRF